MTQDTANNKVAKSEDKEKSSPPYIPFLTFNNMITWLESESVPVKFDRSFWGKKYGGSLGTQLMAGMRFLGLLKDDFTQPPLGEIVKAKGDDRKKLLADLIQKAYSSIDFTQLSGATPNMLKEWFVNYGLDGSADRKARSFFINACKFYDVPIHKSLAKTARNKQPGAPREKKGEKDKITQPEDKGDKFKVKTPPSSGTSELQDLFKIFLSDGCELKLCLNKDFFELGKTDRELIDNLVELMKRYRDK